VSEFASPALSAWQSFYVMVGSSGAALIGIQFVVIALVAKLIISRCGTIGFGTRYCRAASTLHS
jgi:hypothetical protein